ncbi:ECF transporter S component [Virgibacillus flavescens]|uniref:ECF transporter S component n=1 Tax=Virgibacillus flavescens TaxID=1611422 RepID=UPI003D33AF7E
MNKSQKINTYKLTLIALLAALSVVGRITFSFIPNVQPVTAIIIICGIFLGPIAAITLSVLTTFLTNMILGMGIWTIWQIIAWALIGLTSGLIGKYRKKHSIFLLTVYAVCCGYFYGLILSLNSFTISGDFLPYYLAGLPFDTAHAIGNGIFIVLLYPIISFFFKKYASKRFTLQNTN